MTSTADPREVTRATDPNRAQDNQAWHDEARRSLDGVRRSANAWSTGAAGVTALVLGALLSRDPADIAATPARWRLALTVIVTLGMLAAIIGLWLLVAASASTARTVSREQLVEEHGSIQAARQARLEIEARKMVWGRRLVITGLICFTGAVPLQWWTPQAPATSVATIETATEDHCGPIIAATDTALVLQTSDTGEPVVINLADVIRITTTDRCL